MKFNPILHIPHSSKIIPEKYRNYFTDENELSETILKLTDTLTDDLFENESLMSVVFPYSRVFCDVERYDSEKEIMNKYGQGVIYKNGLNGKLFKNQSDEVDREIIKDFYLPHIEKITSLVVGVENPLIIDCHSFSHEIYKTTPFTNIPNIDFCIGYNEGDDSGRLLAEFGKTFFGNLGFKVEVNAPYAGSYTIFSVPSLMIEVNKRTYLSGDYISRLSDYYKIKNVIKLFINKISELPTHGRADGLGFGGRRLT